MVHILPLPLLVLSLNVAPSLALPNFWNIPLPSWPTRSVPAVKRDIQNINFNPDGSPFLWLLQDEYKGKSFYDRWKFFDHPDPTNGHVNYINKTAAFESGLVYVEDGGKVIMKADHTTKLNRGVFRNSIRIESIATYNTGLFVLDLNQAPWGCGVWPAFWTVGGNWPYGGEIDIIEGVHDNQHNQVAWHTAPGCKLNTTAGFTGTISSNDGKNHTDCNSFINSNAGCGITEWSRASYGPYFDSQGGGVFAMKWDENDISIWSFYRAAIPKDVAAGNPNPSGWGLPSARLHASQCDIRKFFGNHSIVFDITFCGDWAGNSYATSRCPGTCEERLMEPKNFENATWSINSLNVYRKQALAGHISTSSSPHAFHTEVHFWMSLCLAVFTCIFFV
ncbi:glycoside hydrolase family 16 protein [Hebeloma cylindrosporum]|uniref:Glycoside hydrolase family 16 protein n=1 Tax=Hebeloma cylindrosporum TaxID=76867 RepID=A0A0C3CHI8_HEBCY|nr:glycoside hydrolase family 16 protein [Hebeloma cylindrosporum h7]